MFSPVFFLPSAFSTPHLLHFNHSPLLVAFLFSTTHTTLLCHPVFLQNVHLWPHLQPPFSLFLSLTPTPTCIQWFLVTFNKNNSFFFLSLIILLTIVVRVHIRILLLFLETGNYPDFSIKQQSLWSSFRGNPPPVFFCFYFGFFKLVLQKIVSFSQMLPYSLPQVSLTATVEQPLCCGSAFVYTALFISHSLTFVPQHCLYILVPQCCSFFAGFVPHSMVYILPHSLYAAVWPSKLWAVYFQLTLVLFFVLYDRKVKQTGARV